MGVSDKRRGVKKARGMARQDAAQVLELPLSGDRLKVAGLFAGIGGLELGLKMAGHQASLLCEIDEPAARVLRAYFPGVPLERDVRDVCNLRDAELVAAGFPCQDLSQAGQTAGISGSRSGLVSEVFRLLKTSKPRWLLLENVSFMLSLDKGSAMRYLTTSLEELGYRWAYRVVDTRAFGLPQRRQRVLMLASQTDDPRDVLLADDAGEPEEPDFRGRPCGFYWTEGLKGVGWAVDAIPTIKGGSTLGIPSAPAIWMPSGLVGTPDIRDAERLQGFPEDWTAPSVDSPTRKNSPRWKLVGNAVSVPVAQWVGSRLREPGQYEPKAETLLSSKARWPRAAWGEKGRVVRVDVSEWPIRRATPGLARFLRYPLMPLSARAAEGFLKRARASSLYFEEGFLEAVEAHLRKMLQEAARSNSGQGSVAAGS
jgi:DNA (cytosine-5)-methyltransferase 1